MALRLTIDSNDIRPIYRQVADGIKALIAKGQLPPGSALPPVRQLAADLGVNMNTIAGAYNELQAEGLLTVRHGSGAVVSSQRTSVGRSDLRRTIRTTLTELVLAGLPRAEIMHMVDEELRALLKGAK